MKNINLVTCALLGIIFFSYSGHSRGEAGVCYDVTQEPESFRDLTTTIQEITSRFSEPVGGRCVLEGPDSGCDSQCYAEKYEMSRRLINIANDSFSYFRHDQNNFLYYRPPVNFVINTLNESGCVNFTFPNNWNPLMYAASYGNIYAIQRLLESGANPDSFPPETSPLHLLIPHIRSMNPNTQPPVQYLATIKRLMTPRAVTNVAPESLVYFVSKISSGAPGISPLREKFIDIFIGLSPQEKEKMMNTFYAPENREYSRMMVRLIRGRYTSQGRAQEFEASFPQFLNPAQ